MKITKSSLIILGFVLSGALLISAAAQDEESMDGRALFTDTHKCNMCHGVEADDIEPTTESEEKKGPDLSGFTPENGLSILAEFLRDEEEHKEPFKGTDEELQTIIDWLGSLDTEEESGRAKNEIPYESMDAKEFVEAQVEAILGLNVSVKEEGRPGFYTATIIEFYPEKIDKPYRGAFKLDSMNIDRVRGENIIVNLVEGEGTRRILFEKFMRIGITLNSGFYRLWHGMIEFLKK